LEKACLAEAGWHFTQAQHTPLLSSPLLDIFGKCGYQKVMTQVLDGMFVPPTSCDRYTEICLAAVARPLTVTDIPLEHCPPINRDGRKLGKQLVSQPQESTLDIILWEPSIPRFRLSMQQTMVDIPLQMGFTYKQWKTGLNIMIKKMVGDFNVEKLCITLLFEADFSANNKWLGQAIMYQVEHEQLMVDEQFGSHKFKLAIYQCLNKHLLYNLIHFWHMAAALCSNDAKSCYDRITLLAAALCLCCLGCSQFSARSMITTIHKMQHHIQTFGDLATSASHTIWHAPIAGIGQGNGAGPQIWAAVSSPC